jgi:hypothetical protein
MAGHWSEIPIVVITREKRGIQYSMAKINCGDYWMPAFAGMAV